MTKNFETKMTIAAGFIINRTNDINDIIQEFDSYDLPQPEGEGWQLKQIIPVHNNTRFLQYFWEREVDVIDLMDNENNSDGQIKDSTITLKI
jgi:hypothetical protein